MIIWLAIGVGTVVCYGFKLAGLSLPDRCWTTRGYAGSPPCCPWRCSPR